MAAKYDDQWSLRILYEINGLIRADGNLQDKFYKAIDMIKKSIECDSVSLFLYNEEKKNLEEVATVGSRVDLIESTQFEMGSGFSAWVAKKRDSVLLPNVRKGIVGGFKSFISTPLLSGDNLIGVINVGHPEPDYFNEKHQHFLDIIAGELAGTIERSRFEVEIVEKNSALVMANNEIVKQQKQIVEMEKYQTLMQVAASINHEINNPLTTIIGNIELLLMKYTDMDKQMEKKLKVILNESRRIEEIIKKLRDVKKIVVQDYIKKSGEKMIDVERSSEKNGEENLS
ncbi:histidine kinase dimerization/phospho-acceptor domain-containing protein [Candidatus Latescibacterota bacterium]